MFRIFNEKNNNSNNHLKGSKIKVSRVEDEYNKNLNMVRQHEQQVLPVQQQQQQGHRQIQALTIFKDKYNDDDDDNDEDNNNNNNTDDREDGNDDGDNENQDDDNVDYNDNNNNEEGEDEDEMNGTGAGAGVGTGTGNENNNDNNTNDEKGKDEMNGTGGTSGGGNGSGSGTGTGTSGNGTGGVTTDPDPTSSSSLTLVTCPGKQEEKSATSTSTTNVKFYYQVETDTLNITDVTHDEIIPTYISNVLLQTIANELCQTTIMMDEPISSTTTTTSSSTNNTTSTGSSSISGNSSTGSCEVVSVSSGTLDQRIREPERECVPTSKAAQSCTFYGGTLVVITTGTDCSSTAGSSSSSTSHTVNEVTLGILHDTIHSNNTNFLDDVNEYTYGSSWTTKPTTTGTSSSSTGNSNSSSGSSFTNGTNSNVFDNDNNNSNKETSNSESNNNTITYYDDLTITSVDVIPNPFLDNDNGTSAVGGVIVGISNGEEIYSNTSKNENNEMDWWLILLLLLLLLCCCCGTTTALYRLYRRYLRGDKNSNKNQRGGGDNDNDNNMLHNIGNLDDDDQDGKDTILMDNGNAKKSNHFVSSLHPDYHHLGENHCGVDVHYCKSATCPICLENSFYKNNLGIVTMIPVPVKKKSNNQKDRNVSSSPLPDYSFTKPTTSSSSNGSDGEKTIPDDDSWEEGNHIRLMKIKDDPPGVTSSLNNAVVPNNNETETNTNDINTYGFDRNMDHNNHHPDNNNSSSNEIQRVGSGMNLFHRLTSLVDMYDNRIKQSVTRKKKGTDDFESRNVPPSNENDDNEVRSVDEKEELDGIDVLRDLTSYDTTYNNNLEMNRRRGRNSRDDNDEVVQYVRSISLTPTTTTTNHHHRSSGGVVPLNGSDHDKTVTL